MDPATIPLTRWHLAAALVGAATVAWFAWTAICLLAEFMDKTF